MNVDIDKLSDLSSVQCVIDDLSADEKSLDKSILDLVCRRDELERRMTQLSCSFPDFDQLKSSANRLSDMIGQASELAVDLSSKIRQLDLVKSRVQDCVTKLDSILRLKTCSGEVGVALDQEKFEEAAEHICTFLNTDSSVLQLSPKIVSDEVARDSVAKLTTYHMTLVQLVEKRFDEALQRHDSEAVDRFCKLFPLVGMHDDGLRRFGSYLCSIISKRCNGFMNLSELPDSDNMGKATSCLDLLTQILEFIAELMTAKQAFVETYYGPGNLYPIIAAVQSQCDIFVGRVIDRFRSQHALNELMELTESSFGNTVGRKPSIQPTTSSNVSTAVKDITTDNASYKRTLAIEPIVTDLVLIYTRVELYMRFARRRVSADIRNVTSSNAACEAKLKEIHTFFDNCQAVRCMQDLIGTYISLESYYLRQMIIKAVNSDEVNDTAKTFCFADDVFFVLKRCLSRSLSSGNVNGICAMLNQACSVLLDHLITNALATRIRAGFPSGWMQDAYSYMQISVGAVAPAVASSTVGASGTSSISAANVSATGPSSSGKVARHQFLLTLNTIELCLNNLETLNDQVRRDLTTLFDDPECVACGKVQACLVELQHSVSGKLNNLLDSGMDQLTTSIIRGHVKSILHPFSSNQYDLSEDDLDLYSANDPWIQTCISELENFLVPFRSVLSTGNNDRFVSVLAAEMVRTLESQLRQKTFNRLGAIQVEKEIRCLFNYVTGVTYAPIRDHFTRLLQMCILLNLDKVDEVLFYWNNSTWRLVPNEVRLILSLRKEFVPDEIRRLKL